MTSDNGPTAEAFYNFGSGPVVSGPSPSPKSSDNQICHMTHVNVNDFVWSKNLNSAGSAGA